MFQATVKEEKVDEASHKGVELGDKDFLGCDSCLYDYMFVFSHEFDDELDDGRYTPWKA